MYSVRFKCILIRVDFTERFAVGICHTQICLMAAPDPSSRGSLASVNNHCPVAATHFQAPPSVGVRVTNHAGAANLQAPDVSCPPLFQRCKYIWMLCMEGGGLKRTAVAIFYSFRVDVGFFHATGGPRLQRKQAFFARFFWICAFVSDAVLQIPPSCTCSNVLGTGHWSLFKVNCAVCHVCSSPFCSPVSCRVYGMRSVLHPGPREPQNDKRNHLRPGNPAEVR